VSALGDRDEHHHGAGVHPGIARPGEVKHFRTGALWMAFRSRFRAADSTRCWGRFGAEEFHDSRCSRTQFPCFAFPNRENIPSCRPQPLLVLPVPLLISPEFRAPVPDSGLGNVGLWATAVPMPETALDLDDLQQPWKDQIRSAGKCVDMKPVAESHSMHNPPHHNLRRRVLASDFAHVLAAPVW
jgi:hypothetical protein